MKLPMQILAACALAFTAAATIAAADTRQLAASAGLDAAGPDASLVEVVRAKNNNDGRPDDRLVVVIDAGDAGPAARAQLAAAAGVEPTEAATMSMGDLAVAKFNRDARKDDRIAVADGGVGVRAFAAMRGTPEVGRRLTPHEVYHAEAIREAAGRE